MGSARGAVLVVASCVVLALAARISQAEQRRQVTPPNVVLIVSDDQGYGDLGCYGSFEIKTSMSPGMRV